MSCSPDNSKVRWRLTKWGAVAAFVAGFGLGFFMTFSPNGDIELFYMGNFAGLLSGIAVEVVYWIVAFRYRCPWCCAWWSKFRIGEQILDRYITYEPVTISTRYYSSKGELIKEEKKSEDAPVLVEKYIEIFKCITCERSWKSSTKKRRFKKYYIETKRFNLKDSFGTIIGKVEQEYIVPT